VIVPSAGPRGPCTVPVSMTEQTFTRLQLIGDALGVDWFDWIEEAVEELVAEAYTDIVGPDATP
jgi:hypothetical protein